MTRHRIIGLFLFALFAQTSIGQIWTQDFETNGLGTAYTSAPVFSANLNAHFNRTNGINISNTVSPYSGYHGSFFWAGENINIAAGGGDGLSNKIITFAAFNVAGQTNLQLRGLFGTGNPLAAWDYSDILYVEYKMDASAWTKIMQFATNGLTQNTGLYLDANLDGIGEGVALSTHLQQFSAPIPAIGTSLQLRVYARCTSQGEEFAFDDLRVYSTTTAVSGCTQPAAANFNPAANVDNGSCSLPGCTDASALNYQSWANQNDGSCIYTTPAIVINEIHYNPNDNMGFTDLGFEFIELINNSSSPVNIGGWRLAEAIDVVFPTNTIIAANSYVLACSTPLNYNVPGIPIFQFTDDLNNLGETIRLYNAQNVLVDIVSYLPNGTWPQQPNGNGPSLELINPNLDNSDGLQYCGADMNGTPGITNSCYNAQILGCTNPLASNYNPIANTNDGSCLIAGCVIPTALNYNPSANVYDGSCTFAPVILGCTYPTASNYNANATDDNGTCVFTSNAVLGCTYVNAVNFNPSATQDNGTCQFTNTGTPGCTYANASNFNPSATLDNGSCLFTSNAIQGCTYAFAANYNAAATQDDGSCQLPIPISGCTYADASNYNALATIDNGSCVYDQGIAGCTYLSANNYNPLATVDNGSCIWTVDVMGCAYNFAANYNPNATQDDGSCILPTLLVGCTYPNAINYNAMAQEDDGTCIFELATPGCTYDLAFNYSPSATADDGTCLFPPLANSCTGDINADGIVGVEDLLIFISQYGSTCN